MDTEFTCEISAPLLTVNSIIVLPDFMIDFRPADLKGPRYEHHTFSACDQAHILGSEHIHNDPERGHKLPMFQVLFKSVVGTEIFYEVQIIMCYPFAHKPKQFPVSLSIVTGRGNVVLLDGVQLKLIDPTIFCCAGRTGYSQYIYNQFPTCSLASIIDSVWFEPRGTETYRRIAGPDRKAGRPYLKLVLSGTLPVPKDDEHESHMSALKSHLDNMKSLFHDGTMSDVSVNGIPCHKAILAGQSDVFQAMLTSDMAEKNSGEIVLEESKEAVEALLKFIYYCETSELDKLGNEAIVQLIQLGHRLNIPALVQSSVKSLMARPGEDSALDSRLILNLFDFSQKAQLPLLESTIISIFKRRQAEDEGQVQDLIQCNSELAARLLTKSLSNQTSIFLRS